MSSRRRLHTFLVPCGSVGTRLVCALDHARTPEGAGKPRPYKLRTLLVAALALATTMCARAELQPGDPLPASVSGASGVPPTEGRVVLLDFWASWCAPCKASFPAFTRLHEEFSARGLVIIAVGIDEKESAHAAFLKKTQPPFFTTRDAAHAIVADVRPPAMPTSYIFGRDGRLRSVHSGFHGKQTEDELRTQLEALLAEEK